MKKVIYYFSGTGNSMRAAIKIAERIGGAEIISVRCNAEEVPAIDADIIGFISPVYEWDVPGFMKEFIKKLDINPKAYIFMISTYVAVLGKSFETVEGILNKKGAHLSYGRAVRCVASQCIAYTPFPSEKIMVPFSEKKLEKVGREIKEGKIRKYPRMSPLSRKMYQKMMVPYCNVEKEFDKGLYTSSDCTGCGICKKSCSVNNITFEDNHPVWNHKCNGCMACVVYCPNKAIKYKIPKAYVELDTVITRRMCLPDDRKRYHNPYIKAKDIAKDRQYIEGIDS